MVSHPRFPNPCDWFCNCWGGGNPGLNVSYHDMINSDHLTRKIQVRYWWTMLLWTIESIQVALNFCSNSRAAPSTRGRYWISVLALLFERHLHLLLNWGWVSVFVLEVLAASGLDTELLHRAPTADRGWLLWPCLPPQSLTHPLDIWRERQALWQMAMGPANWKW